MEEDATIIQFPVQKLEVVVPLDHPSQFRKICSECDFAMLGNAGVFCSVFREDIYDEKLAAEECEEYKPQAWVKARIEKYRITSRN